MENMTKRSSPGKKAHSPKSPAASPHVHEYDGEMWLKVPVAPTGKHDVESLPCSQISAPIAHAGKRRAENVFSSAASGSRTLDAGEFSGSTGDAPSRGQGSRSFLKLATLNQTITAEM